MFTNFHILCNQKSWRTQILFISFRGIEIENTLWNLAMFKLKIKICLWKLKIIHWTVVSKVSSQLSGRLISKALKDRKSASRQQSGWTRPCAFTLIPFEKLIVKFKVLVSFIICKNIFVDNYSHSTVLKHLINNLRSVFFSCLQIQGIPA